MISRHSLAFVLVIGLAACVDTPIYPTPVVEEPPTIATLSNDCVNPTVRNELGTQATGLKMIRLRARIAQNSLGAVALEDDTQIANDVHVLNSQFASSNVRFLLDDIELLPRDEALYEATDNPLCNEVFKPLAEDSIPMLYVGNLVFSSGQVPGTGNACGAVINSRIRSPEFDGIEGAFSNVEAVPRMMGYVLGLVRTHSCRHIEGYENNPELSGDLVADTPFDPGSANELLKCGETTAPGKCIFTDATVCEIQCADGSTPDVHNLMSSYSGCRYRFSKGQSVYMRCAVELQHSQAKCNNVWTNEFGEGWEGTSSQKPAHIADVDGDGKGDAVLYYAFTEPKTWRVALSTGYQFAPSTIWGDGVATDDDMFNDYMVADVNGDKKADAVIKNLGTWFVALSTGTAFSTPTVWTDQHGGVPWLADVDGDGKADAVTLDRSTNTWSVALSTGSAFATPTPWGDGIIDDSYDEALGDVDGDGKADIVAHRAHEAGDGSWGCGWRVARSTGSGFEPVESWYSSNCIDEHSWNLADIDGDKKLDLVVSYHRRSSWFVQLSTGASFEKPRLGVAGLLISSKYTSSALVGDVDGDNKAEFIAFDRDNATWTTNICRPDASGN